MNRTGKIASVAGTVGVATAVLLGGVSGCDPGATAAIPPTERACVSRGGMQFLPTAARNAKLDQIKAMGADYIRFDFQWSDIEQTKGTDTWTIYDDFVDAATLRGLKILGNITYTPRWASGAPAGSSKADYEKWPPTTTSWYGDFARRVALHFPDVTHWEIWNEPNNADFFKPTISVAKYTAMLKSAYTGIKSVSDDTVVSGGLSGYGAYSDGESADHTRMNPLVWLERMYAAGAHGYFDALGWHPYDTSGPPTVDRPWNTWTQMYQVTDKHPSALKIMEDNGDSSLRVYATEWGYPSQGGYGTTQGTPEFQRKNIAEGMDFWMGDEAWYRGGLLCVFTYDDALLGASSPIKWGLVDINGLAKPAYLAYQNAARDAG